MSKARRTARAARELEAARRTEQMRVAQQARAAHVARRQRRALAWRRIRLWQHGPSFGRQRERWGALATLVLMILLLVYLVSGSWSAVVGCALALAVCGPVLVLLFFDRSHK